MGVLRSLRANRVYLIDRGKVGAKPVLRLLYLKHVRGKVYDTSVIAIAFQFVVSDLN